MEQNAKDNKRIAKNTLFLYFRLLITMAINIYCSRVVLKALGVEDYGIYSVVAGVIILFSFINSSMSTATSRFITFELGKDSNTNNLQKVFSSACTIHLVIAIVVLILAETIGLYLLLHKLVIPENRKFTAMIIYQTSIVMVVINILQTPYTASIFAHERINIYASVEILNSLLKLTIALVLPFFSSDKLIAYSTMLFVASLIVFLVYAIYSSTRFQGCKFALTRDKEFIKPMSSFSGWDLYGNMSTVARTQGINILLNMFFGTAMNAANAIAIQVQGAVNTFAVNLLLAVRPQIVKSYVKGNIQYTLWLLENTVKLTTILLFILCLPLIVEMPFILKIWLGEYPEYTIIFARLTLIFIIIANISLSLMSVLHAVGNIKKSSIVNGSIYLTVVPLTYIAFKMDLPAYIPFILNIIFVMIGCVLNMIYIKQSIQTFSIQTFLRKCIFSNIFIAIMITIVAYLVVQSISSGWTRLFIVLFLNAFLNIILGYLVVLDKDMKILVKNKIQEYGKKGFS